MKHCKVCGMENDANPSHGASYKRIGQHAFSPEVEDTTSIAEDIIISFGGGLKSLGEGKFEGYLVRFSSADDPDLVGDYFTKSTEFFVENGAILPILYDHGLNPTMKKAKIGRAKVSYDDAGLFIKGELETAEAYKQFLSEIKTKLIDKGKAGLSSGAASHMVSRKQIKKGINEILEWGIAEASVTPAPTEPKLVAQSLKSYFDEHVDPMNEEPVEEKGMAKKDDSNPTGQKKDDEDDTDEMPKKKKTSSEKAVEDEEPEETLVKTINSPEFAKGLFEEKLKEKTPSVWEIRNVLDQAYSDIAKAGSVSDITGVTVDIEAKVKESKLEEAAREIPLVVKQIEEWIEKGGDKDGCGSKYFYLRSIQDTGLEQFSVEGCLANGLTLNEHSERVVHAAEEYANLGASLVETVKALEERCVKKIEYRANDPVKSGRKLSKATVQEIEAVKQANLANIQKQQELDSSLSNLLTLAQPKAGGEAETLQMQFMMARTQTELALEGQAVS